MTNWAKSANLGGVYASSIHSEYHQKRYISQKYNFEKSIEFLAKIREFTQKYWKIGKKASFSAKNCLGGHISRKQEVYWPVLVAIILILFVFASRIASAETEGKRNNLPISTGSKLNLAFIGKTDGLAKICAGSQTQEDEIAEKEKLAESENECVELKNDIDKILKNTPMAAMTDFISEKDRIVAAFIVGIAMKESKFGVYAPHLGGKDCYNYWGIKAGGKTVSGGYTCFASPEDAVNVVGKTIEKMVGKGVRNPAQAISWKCGSSCAGHDPAGVRKWIADVGVNFYKINS